MSGQMIVAKKSGRGGGGEHAGKLGGQAHQAREEAPNRGRRKAKGCAAWPISFCRTGMAGQMRAHTGERSTRHCLMWQVQCCPSIRPRLRAVSLWGVLAAMRWCWSEFASE